MALVRQSIEIILDTEPGERVMEPLFGCGLRRYLMAPNNAATRTAIRNNVVEALTLWEPRIRVTEVSVTAGGDRVEVVLDQDDGVAGVDQPVQLAQQQGDVGRVQAGRRLVEQVERVAAPGPLQLGRQLDALRLAAAELGRRLAEPQVAQPDVAQRLQAARGRPARRRGTPRPRRPTSPARRRWSCPR